uniref:DUF1985 domain-containing protein n=1 Tax=Solanum tuberosum TaxID=4113 RepID=M1DTC9_SOLTU
MFVVKINDTVLRFGIKEFAAVTGLKCGLLRDFDSDPSIQNRLIEKYFGIMTKVPKLDFLNKFKEANFFEPEDRFKIGILYFISTFLTGSEASKTTIPKLYFDLVETVLTAKEMNVIDHNNLHESSSHHETENQATSERNDVDLDEKYVELKNEIVEKVYKNMIELKAYVDNSTKLIIDEIRSSRGQPTQTSHQEVNYTYSIIVISEAQNSIDQTVGGVSNADLLGSSASKPPSLDDYPDLTMTQIFQLEPILNVTTTPDVQPRNRNPTSTTHLCTFGYQKTKAV